MLRTCTPTLLQHTAPRHILSVNPTCPPQLALTCYRETVGERAAGVLAARSGRASVGASTDADTLGLTCNLLFRVTAGFVERLADTDVPDVPGDKNRPTARVGDGEGGSDEMRAGVGLVLSVARFWAAMRGWFEGHSTLDRMLFQLKEPQRLALETSLHSLLMGQVHGW